MSDRIARVNYSQLQKLVRLVMLEKGMPATMNIQGGAGGGKTSLVRSFSQDPKIGLVEVMTAAELAEPGDLTGAPQVINGVMHYAPPHFAATANELANDYQTVLLYFDDFNRVPGQIQQSLMPCFLDRRIGGYRLKDNVRPILTSNPANSEHYATRELDVAQSERVQTFELIFDFKIFIQHAMQMQWVPEWVAFLRLLPEHVALDGKGISPRTCEFAHQALSTCLEDKLKLTEELTALRLDAVVGMDVRIPFVENCRLQIDIIAPEVLIKGQWTAAQSKLLKSGRPDLVQLTFFRLASHIHRLCAEKGEDKALTNKEAENVRKFILEHKNDEQTLIFLKSIPQASQLAILDVDAMEEIRGRVWG